MKLSKLNPHFKNVNICIVFINNRTESVHGLKYF